MVDELPLLIKKSRWRWRAEVREKKRSPRFSRCIPRPLYICGYFHGVTSLTFGVDIETIRWFGILQRISIGYIVSTLCEIWLPRRTQMEARIFKSYYLHWCFAFALSAIYLWLLYGLYVPDWQFRASDSTSFASSSNDGHIVHTMKCAVRGDLGPACNSTGMIDRYILGVSHLYKKPVYRNLKECNGQVSEDLPSWCLAPFDPEGILSAHLQLFNNCCYQHHRTLVWPCSCTIREP